MVCHTVSAAACVNADRVGASRTNGRPRAARPSATAASASGSPVSARYAGNRKPAYGT